MNIFDQLGRIYSEIDSNYASLEIDARSKGQYRKEATFTLKRQLNDQAYFLFMFTRIEDRIRSLSDNLIDNKIAKLTDWKVKRTWEIIQTQKKNGSLHFLNRVTLLTQKGQADFNLIKMYYDQRNKIGHGGTFTIPISIPTVITDMNRLYRDLNI